MTTKQRTIQTLKNERAQARKDWAFAYHTMWDAAAEKECADYVAAITNTIEELSR